MWNDRIDEQTIALAGLYQACQIVSKIAWNGEYNEQELVPLINCIIKIDSTNTENIYIDVSKLEPGLVYFRKQIVGDIFTRSSETRRYIASLNKLSDTLMSDNSCIKKIQLLLKNFSGESKSMTTDEKTIELSNIYQETLSKFEPRIVVNGENKFLTDENHSSRIRTALFAGVRSVILWRQLGGSKLKLLFLKGQFSKQIDNYLDSITN
ncbi:MAG: DUF489 family protein [Pseudomonadota bacterium]|nr:DUF489 family protein [Pseudomonadota bacterium]